MHDCSPAAPTTASNSYKTIISFNEKLLFLQKFEQLWSRPSSAAAVSQSTEVTGEAAEGSSDSSSFLTSSANNSAEWDLAVCTC